MNTMARTAAIVAGVTVALLGSSPTVSAQEGTDAAQRRHEVNRGDTLWDLARRYLVDPYRWRDIYDLNRDVVQDPHWIYPGERLRIPGSATIAVERMPDDASRLSGKGTGRPIPATDLSNTVFGTRSDQLLSLSSLQVDESVRPQIVSVSDFFKASLLLNRSEFEPTGTTARVIEENPLDLNLPPTARLHQDVIVQLGGLEAAPGDFLQTVRWGRNISPFGEVLESKALLLVTRATSDSARARVVDVYGDYSVGDPVVRAADFFLDPEAEHVGTDSQLVGRIIAFATENQTVLDLYDEVFIDLGRRDGIRIGDEFLVFSHLEPSPALAEVEDALCVIRVVRVTESTSTAVVFRVRDPGTREGNPVRLARRLSG